MSEEKENNDKVQINSEDFPADKKSDLRIISIAAGAAVIFVAVAGIAIAGFFKKTDSTIVPNIQGEDTKQEELGEEPGERRLLDGVLVAKDEVNPPLWAVMIDNHSDARPSFGLNDANLVIEAEAEGGITRFMAIFANKKGLDKVGSVRSARSYFVDWVHEYGALYVHCGGSPEALVKIEQDGIRDLNEFYNAPFFWRDKVKMAPHNVYTSSEKIASYFDDNKVMNGDFASWKFKDDAPLEQRPVQQKIKIDFLLPGYDVEWNYDKENNNYIRKMGDDFHKDGSGNILSAKNVIIQYASAREVDEKLRLDMDIIGNGKGQVCRDGKCQKGEWRKKNSSDRTRFYMDDGTEFEFNAGQTWIEVVRPERSVIME